MYLTYEPPQPPELAATNRTDNPAGHPIPNLNPRRYRQPHMIAFSQRASHTQARDCHATYMPAALSTSLDTRREMPVPRPMQVSATLSHAWQTSTQLARLRTIASASSLPRLDRTAAAFVYLALRGGAPGNGIAEFGSLKVL